jgi:hypothetical protein
MKIIKATYGGVDVSEKLQSCVKNNKLFVRADNNLFGDTNAGVLKYLDVELEYNGEIHKSSTEENKMLIFPKNDIKKLGIFYSDNFDTNIRSCILASLQSIEKAALNKADIITNMWWPEPENPFLEIISTSQSRSHLNQVLQILQLLFTAQTIKNYEYVSFLEHDVLYAEGYFDYNHFDEDYIINTNYIGMRKEGFQSVRQNDKPTSQITMKFDFALNHFLKILPNALMRNAGSLEPHWSDSIKYSFKVYKALNPNIHINHGRHFTSHFDCFYHDYQQNNDYWGNITKYNDLFFR